MVSRFVDGVFVLLGGKAFCDGTSLSLVVRGIVYFFWKVLVRLHNVRGFVPLYDYVKLTRYVPN